MWDIFVFDDLIPKVDDQYIEMKKMMQKHVEPYDVIVLSDVDTVVLSDAPSPEAAQNIVVFTQDVKHHTWIYVQLFSLMLHKNASDKFSFENCKFTIQRSKESTGR